MTSIVTDTSKTKHKWARGWGRGPGQTGTWVWGLWPRQRRAQAWGMRLVWPSWTLYLSRCHVQTGPGERAPCLPVLGSRDAETGTPARGPPRTPDHFVQKGLQTTDGIQSHGT